MIIKKFKAENFRNIEFCDISFSEGVNVLYGNNAEGKTNAIEGIYYFARGKSFRIAEDKELIKFGNEGFRIYIEYEDKNGENSLEYVYYKKDRKRKKNGYKIDKISEFIGNFKAVLFFPDDLSLVKGSPEERRNFLNVAVSQCYPAYIKYYYNYKKALDNRNCILKMASKGNYIDQNELISWSYYMAEYASYIYCLRNSYIKMLSSYAKKIIKDISFEKEDVDFYYKSDINEELKTREVIEEKYRKIFTDDIEKEKIVGSSLYGIQRDDIFIEINGKNSRNFASQGQQRSIVLAMKLSEGEVIKDITGEYPVFLLDDVFSELDKDRRKYLIDTIGERQVIISSCEDDGEALFLGKIIKVERGKYE